MDFNFEVNNSPPSGGGGGGTVTQVGTGTGLTGGPITTVGTISLAPISTLFLLANLSGGSSAPTPHSLSNILDTIIDDTQGDLLYRNGTVWTFLPPGTAGQVLTTGGASANPAWSSTGDGSVTSVATGTGLTGGPITTTGTISLAAIGGGNLLANLSLGSAAPTPHTLSAILDYVFGNSQGDLLFRSSTGWGVLSPGDSGQVLTTGGLDEDIAWATTGEGSVTSVATGAGLIGGPITTTGTISFANITNNMMLANISGMGNPASGHTVSDVLDSAFSDIQGSILYRNNAVWSYLTPGASGTVLTSGGTGENLAWGVSGNIIGAVNVGVGQGIYVGTSSNNLELQSLRAGPGIDIGTDGTTITITNTGSSGGDFEYVDTFWVAQNGNDANDGKSINSPKLTITGAILAFTTPTTPSLINIVDEGLYRLNYTSVTSQRFGINAPGAIIQSSVSGQPAFTAVTGSTIVINTAILQNNVSGSVLLLAGGLIQVNVINLIGNVTGGGTFRGYFDNWLGNGGLSGGDMYLIGNTWTGNYAASDGDLYLTCNIFNGPLTLFEGNANAFCQIMDTGDGFTLNNTGTGLAVGFFGNSIQFSQNYGIGINYNNQAFAQEIAWKIPVTDDFTPTSSQSNALFVYDANPNAVCLLLPYHTDPTFPIGYRISVIQQQAGNVQFQSGDPIESVSNRRWTEGRGSVVTATVMDIGPNPMSPEETSYFWSLSGQIAGSAFTGADSQEIYFSALYGDDTTGIGSYTQPFATPGAAITAAGTPTANVNITCIDDETYTATNITIAQPFINLIAPGATFSATSGDVITVSAASASVNIVLGGLTVSGGGNALNNSSSSNVMLTIGALSGGPITTDNGTVVVRGGTLSCNKIVTGSGSIKFVSAANSGTNTGAVTGVSPQGSVGAFAIGANTFSATDSTAGYVWTTNGGGISSLQPPAGGFTWNGVSGTTQAAAVNNGYIIQNASQTTVTLPATAALGSVVSVQGLGAGGWILAANTGQTVQIGNTATSSGGTVTSANQWDSGSVVCVVANTTWALSSSVTSGFTIA